MLDLVHLVRVDSGRDEVGAECVLRRGWTRGRREGVLDVDVGVG